MAQNAADAEAIRNVIILGGGPAGLTAALYTARANLAPLLIEGEQISNTDIPGGQLMITTEVENYPGFVHGIQGPELMGRIRDQAARVGAEIVTRRVAKVEFDQWPFRIHAGKQQYLARSVIIATGAQALMLGLESEERLLGYGVSTCATCDGFFFKNRDIAVVGGGDSAVEEATYLAKIARSVTLIHRRDQLRASKIMQQRVMEADNIEVRWNTVVAEVLGEDKVTGLKLRHTQSEEHSTLDVDALFVAVGHRPSTDLFAGQLDLSESGYVLTGPGTATSIAGVFACGDVQDDIYRQAVTAAGSGCMAAIDAERWLIEKQGV